MRPPPTSRNDDPWTSREAGEPFEVRTIKPGTHKHIVLRFYAEAADDGLTGSELEDEMNRGTHHEESHRKRISECVAWGLLFNTKEPRLNERTGKPGFVKVITREGRRALWMLDSGETWTGPWKRKRMVKRDD